ncbi:STAS domain-containing protein [Megalodesulfovibrio gigas]|uniref:Anti-sigma factor antagonist n=1 Tax=Megalodesulfovibrio gigas (strain ATCC 19364 / DSM 1382 / NCIMB 9332 / VKM B-1759) TaxID=1121448 RepID=T2GA75_MEGG1|nr:STAS domain-containing protein [Megalodesulfovibrio gigas]AGW13054.1 putative anti-sigma-factor antagonist [Megalodesulfovibrio gigas DSM 1382 = ATCC 19364]
MDFAHRMEEGICIVSVSGRLDAATSGTFGTGMMQLIDDGVLKLALDLTTLEYVSSAGLREFLRAAKALKAKGGSMVCCSLKDYVKEIFDMSGFSTIIPVTASLEEGRNTLA